MGLRDLKMWAGRECACVRDPTGGNPATAKCRSGGLHDDAERQCAAAAAPLPVGAVCGGACLWYLQQI